MFGKQMPPPELPSPWVGMQMDPMQQQMLLAQAQQQPPQNMQVLQQSINDAMKLNQPTPPPAPKYPGFGQSITNSLKKISPKGVKK